MAQLVETDNKNSIWDTSEYQVPLSNGDCLAIAQIEYVSVRGEKEVEQVGFLTASGMVYYLANGRKSRTIGPTVYNGEDHIELYDAHTLPDVIDVIKTVATFQLRPTPVPSRV